MSASCCSCGSICCDTVNQCANLVFSDDFSAALGGYTDTTCPGGTGKTFGVGGGFLTETFGGPPGYLGAAGSHNQAIIIPALSGLCISVSAQIYRVLNKNAGTTSIGIAGVGILSGRYRSPVPAPTQYLTTTGSDANSCVVAGVNHTYGAANTNFVDGDCIQLVLQDTSGGAGTYSLKSYVNGTLLDTFAGLALTLTPGGTIPVGVNDTNGGQWKNLCIATS